MTCSKRLSKKLSVGSALRGEPICDWLDVTCSPIASFYDAIEDWVTGLGACVTHTTGSSTTFSYGEGTLKLSTNFNVHRASASGSFLSALREGGLYRDYINLLGSVGHKVTRLDAALDVHIDSPRILSGLCSVYGGAFHFGRKALRTKTIFEHRSSDNALSGTWYAGHGRSARVSCRVYDKQLERLNRGVTIPPLTRYELTFRKDYGCSLWDALMPKSIFYSHSSSLIEPPLGGYDDWSSRGLVPWTSEPVDSTLTVEKFTKALEFSVELPHLARKASGFGPTGKALVMQRFEALLDSYLKEQDSDFGSLGSIQLEPAEGDSAA